MNLFLLPNTKSSVIQKNIGRNQKYTLEENGCFFSNIPKYVLLLFSTEDRSQTCLNQVEDEYMRECVFFFLGVSYPFKCVLWIKPSDSISAPRARTGFLPLVTLA